MIFNQYADGRKVRQFSVNPAFLATFRDQQPAWGPIGYFTYKRTYARDLPDGGTEEFWQTCQRVVEGCFNIQKIHCNQMGLPWNEQKAQHSAQDMFQRMWDFKFSPPGRGLSVMGTDIVYQRGSASLQNCAFVSSENIAEDFAGPFCFLMDMSMLGVGTGADTKGAGKIKLVVPRVTVEPFVVEDTREGWVDLVRTVLNAFVGKGAYPQTIDYSHVRGRGEPLKTFGGTASGPKPLHDLVVNITKLLMPETADVLADAETNDDWATIDIARVVWDVPDQHPRRITSTQIVDIFNFIGKAVVAGGIRRTAEIMFGEPDDRAFMELKQDTAALNDRRWASNNSVFGYVGMDYTELAQSLAINGEPGLVWLDTAKKFGRLNDPADNKDWRIQGTNPCGEQGLESYELCNLVETYPAHHDSYEDFERTLKMAYLYAKTVTLVPTHDMRANAVMMRNRRIGASMSGIVQAIQKFGRRKFLSWCDNGYKFIQKMDRTYSDWLGIPLSVKTTTVKPSGTVSLLCGATPGIHFPHSEFYIRHVRVQNQSPLCQIARDAGFQVFPDAYADNTSVVAFPVKEKHFIKGKSSVSLWEQFVMSADMQAYWSDNLVSATVTFSKAEIPDIKTCLESFETRLKGVSLLPLLEEDHGYIYPPYQTITEDQYNAMVEGTTEMAFTARVHDTDERFCSGDTCMLAMETSTQKV
jgi:ribonucleoside-triphosphate reductase